MHSGRNQAQGSKLCDAILVKCPEQVAVGKEEGGMGRGDCRWVQTSIWEWSCVLELDFGNVYTTEYIYLFMVRA